MATKLWSDGIFGIESVCLGSRVKGDNHTLCIFIECQSQSCATLLSILAAREWDGDLWGSDGEEYMRREKQEDG